MVKLNTFIFIYKYVIEITGILKILENDFFGEQEHEICQKHLQQPSKVIHVLQDTFKFGEYSVMYMYGIYYIKIGTAVQMQFCLHFLTCICTVDSHCLEFG